MSESAGVLADFMGTFTLEGTWDREPVDGRVLLNPGRLVLVGPDGKETLPLSRLVDVGLGRVPSEYSQYFDDALVAAFDADDRGAPRTATVEADGDAIEQFGTLLFKTQLHETTVLLNHPARVGGRVTDGGFAPATLYLGDDAVAFGDIETPFRIPLDSVVDFGRPKRTVEGATRRVLSIRQVQEGTAMISEIDVRSNRLGNLLGRYLRTEYGKRRGEIEDLDLSATEKRLLVTLHSGGSAADLAGVLDVDPGRVSMLLNRLEAEGLLTTGEDGVHLTSTGRIALEAHLEDINQ